MRAQSMKGCHSCIVRNGGCFGASCPRKMLSDGVLASPPVVPSGVRAITNLTPKRQQSGIAAGRLSKANRRGLAETADGTIFADDPNPIKPVGGGSGKARIGQSPRSGTPSGEYRSRCLEEQRSVAARPARLNPIVHAGCHGHILRAAIGGNRERGARLS
jgi:hypothetical protein